MVKEALSWTPPPNEREISLPVPSYQSNLPFLNETPGKFSAQMVISVPEEKPLPLPKIALQKRWKEQERPPVTQPPEAPETKGLSELESLVGGAISLINTLIPGGKSEALLPPELTAQQQPHQSSIIIQAPERNPTGVIFEAKSQPPVRGQKSQEANMNLPDQALIILETDNETAMLQVIELIEANGGDIVHVFPPDVLIGSLPQGQETALLGQAGIGSIHREAIDPSRVAEETRMAVKVWNTTFVGEPGLGVSPQEIGEPLINDAFVAPDLPLKEGLQATDQQTSDYYQTSKFMIGPVAVGIILPESDGSLDPSIEDWTSEEQVKVFGKIVAAMNWWAVRESKADLSFYYDSRLRVPTGYEPINRPHTDQGLWIGQVMGALGYEASSYFTRVRDYNHALRRQYQTDWAFTIFVADSSHNKDNKFTDGYFAYAYLGGPFMVMTYGNNGYGPNNMDAVTAHETGHIFKALDQYYEAHQCCTYRSGFLRVENQNSQYKNCSSNEPSIMRGLVGPYWSGAVDFYARGQVGWWDPDGNGILAPVDDKELGAEFYPYPPTTNPNPVLRGLAVATPQVAQVEYKTCGSQNLWHPATPGDGIFDQLAEPFTLSPGPLGGGGYCFEVRVTDNQGRVQPEPYPKLEIAIMQPVLWLPLISK